MFKSTYYLLYNRYLFYRQSYHVSLFLIILWNIYCSQLYFTCLFATMRSWRFSVLFFSENCDSAVFASSILWWLAASTTYTTVFALNSFRNSDQYNLALIKPPPAPTKIYMKRNSLNKKAKHICMCRNHLTITLYILFATCDSPLSHNKTSVTFWQIT